MKKWTLIGGGCGLILSLIAPYGWFLPRLIVSSLENLLSMAGNDIARSILNILFGSNAGYRIFIAIAYILIGALIGLLVEKKLGSGGFQLTSLLSKSKKRGVAMRAKDAGEEEDSSKSETKFDEMFLDGNEKLVGFLKRGYLANLALGSGAMSECVVLSDRRLYYSGGFYHKARHTRGLVILPLDKITSISHMSGSNVGCLPISIIIGLILMVLGANMRNDEAGFMMAFGVGTIILGVILHVLLRRSSIDISTPSASISIDLNVYGLENTKKFISQLGRAITRNA